MAVKARTERLGIRTSAEQKELLEAASDLEGTSLSEFVLSHATAAAQMLLADRRYFFLSHQRWAEFSNRLDEPAREVSGLRDLMKLPSVLDLEGE